MRVHEFLCVLNFDRVYQGERVREPLSVLSVWVWVGTAYTYVSAYVCVLVRLGVNVNKYRKDFIMKSYQIKVQVCFVTQRLASTMWNQH